MDRRLLRGPRPDSEIRIFANDELLGSETTEPGGDFAYVTTEPLPSGGVELRLLDVASGEFATTSIVVIVQDDRTSEPLVVASEPGAASEILQGLETPVAPAPVEPAAEPAPEPVEAETPAPQAEESIAVAEVDDIAPEVEAPAPVETETLAMAEVPVIEEPPVVEETPALEEAPAIEQTPAVEEAPVAEDTPEAEAAQLPTRPRRRRAGLSRFSKRTLWSPPGYRGNCCGGRAAPRRKRPRPAVAIVPPTIDAVEIDGDRNFFAGGGTEDLAVRLYVENRPVGTTEVQDGRWLIEAENVLTAQSQRIRADMIDADGEVVGRAEVDFVIDLPEPDPAEAPDEVAEQPVAVAEAPEPVVESEPVADSTPAPVSQPEPAPEVAPAPVAAPEPEATPEPAPAPQPAAEPVPTLVGVTEGERTTSGHVIIRRGDNLWTIARRVYGEGLRYTQIYEANANQIRDPDLIYPGQVFDLPGSDMVIGEQD